jgi:DNA sulfur modification protein DndC
MSSNVAPNRKTAFVEGIKHEVAALTAEIQRLYLEDETPWVVGYSGGKDSTAVAQLIWSAISELSEEQRSKTIHIISTDTLVENPIVATWVNQSLIKMRESAQKSSLPFEVHRLTPRTESSFWVNLLGKGYPAPRHKFRWCTERLKIWPSNQFILDVVKQSGEAIIVLGTRKAESTARKSRMVKLEKQRVRDRLSPNASLPNALVYSPVENWSNDDVWLYLMQYINPWGYQNKDLLTMYQGASPDGECPLVIDTTTPSCGDSRFGCWVCTLVDKDRSMSAMIQNDEEKEWMLPLLRFRDLIDFRSGGKLEGDRDKRDFRKMGGNIQYYRERLVHGPYTQEARSMLLGELLKAQYWIQKNGPSDVSSIELITLEELQEIRRIWVVEKHEIEDNLPDIYEKEMGLPFPVPSLGESLPFNKEEIELLKTVCEENVHDYELIRGLIDVEHRYRTMVSRRGLFNDLENVFSKYIYEDEEDALDMAKRRNDAQEKARDDKQFTFDLKTSKEEVDTRDAS